MTDIDWSQAKPGQRWHYKGPSAQGFYPVRDVTWEGVWTERPTSDTGNLVSERTAASFLRAGLRHMEDRAVTYDRPDGERSMGAAVSAFEAGSGVRLTEEQGWLFMALLKAVRSQQGAYRADSYEDGAAYFALAGEAAAKTRPNLHPPKEAAHGR